MSRGGALTPVLSRGEGFCTQWFFWREGFSPLKPCPGGRMVLDEIYACIMFCSIYFSWRKAVETIKSRFHCRKSFMEMLTKQQAVDRKLSYARLDCINKCILQLSALRTVMILAISPPSVNAIDYLDRILHREGGKHQLPPPPPPPPSPIQHQYQKTQRKKEYDNIEIPVK